MYPRDTKVIEHDLEKASTLLDEAGWRVDPTRDGWRYKGDQRFELTLLIPQGSALGRDIGAIFQEDLQAVGVKMETTLMEWATFSERTRKHEFQAATAAWGTGTDPDMGWNIWHSSSYVPDGSAGRNYVGFRNDRVDELFQAGRQEFDREKRAAIYQEIGRIIYQEQPYTFLFYRPTLWGFDSRIHGVQTSPRGVFGFDPAEQAWWIPAARQAGMSKP
jgi:peptide/nickel transport system substrate-binding protein